MKFKLMFLVLILAIVAIRLLFLKQPHQTIDLDINSRTFRLEIAKTHLQKSRGLSKRSTLCQTCGMIFIYQQERIYPFWMKNTLIPLDIIWLNKHGIIVDIVRGKPNDLSILKPKTKAQYIIELNAGTIQDLNLKINDHIQIPQNL